MWGVCKTPWFCKNPCKPGQSVRPKSLKISVGELCVNLCRKPQTENWNEVFTYPVQSHATEWQAVSILWDPSESLRREMMPERPLSASAYLCL